MRSRVLTNHESALRFLLKNVDLNFYHIEVKIPSKDIHCFEIWSKNPDKKNKEYSFTWLKDKEGQRMELPYAVLKD